MAYLQNSSKIIILRFKINTLDTYRWFLTTVIKRTYTWKTLSAIKFKVYLYNYIHLDTKLYLTLLKVQVHIFKCFHNRIPVEMIYCGINNFDIKFNYIKAINMYETWNDIHIVLRWAAYFTSQARSIYLFTLKMKCVFLFSIKEELWKIHCFTWNGFLKRLLFFFY